jgi:Zn-dependent M28 family amino/carboxypeptidase
MRIALLLVVLAAACRNPPAQEQVGAQAAAQEPVPSALQQAAGTITAEDMRTRIAVLASDSFQGRLTPSPGLEKAAAYIAGEFKRVGLEPRGDSGGYLQRYPLSGRTSDRPPNVVAVLPGSDSVLKNTYIVFSAHMDHLGVGAPNARGDSIYNGADDDASGTSAVVELAEAFASLSERPRRSLLFLTVSGEERGLLGSRYFSDHPPVPANALVADINIDMIGRNAPDMVVGIGQEYSSLGATAQRVVQMHPELGLKVAPDPWPSEQLFFRSDHFNFARIQVPAIFFFAGLHEDYHQPSDEVEKIDADKAARIAKLIFYLGASVADDPQAPQWTAEGLKVVRSLR